jgi:hypothetical protein
MIVAARLSAQESKKVLPAGTILPMPAGGVSSKTDGSQESSELFLTSFNLAMRELVGEASSLSLLWGADMFDFFSFLIIIYMHAGVTQLAECLLPKQNVVGSNPITRSVARKPQGAGFFVVPYPKKPEGDSWPH